MSSRGPTTGKHHDEAPDGNPWIVDDVLRSGRNTYTVFCVSPSEGLEAVRELATDLLDRARESSSPRERRRRNYWL